jgi:P2 family phage contractile tail tube protein
MSTPRSVLKSLNLFVDGRGYAGQIEEINLPKLTLKTEEFQAGGMGAPIELTMGMEKLEMDFSLFSYDRDLLLLFGVVEGRQVQATVRGFLESYDNSTSAVKINVRGKIKEIDRGTWKPGEKSTLKITMALTYYKEEYDATVINEIDVENMVYVSGGVDLFQTARQALGI